MNISVKIFTDEPRFLNVIVREQNGKRKLVSVSYLSDSEIIIDSFAHDSKYNHCALQKHSCKKFCVR